MDPSQVTGFDRRALLRKGVGAAALGNRPPARRQLASVAGCGEAHRKLAEVIGRGRLVVGTGTGNPPWHFDDAGTLSGFDIDMARIIAAGLFESRMPSSSSGRRRTRGSPTCSPTRSTWYSSS